jgi:EAL domain-containing protein (putative c-di-GMP-specific phosphodiesterase class I)
MCPEWSVTDVSVRSRGFIKEIRLAVDIDPRAASGLELEITESLIMEDVKRGVEILQAIRLMGVRIAIDDFGTGFSSLSYLAKLPVDTLKIDRLSREGEEPPEILRDNQIMLVCAQRSLASGSSFF